MKNMRDRIYELGVIVSFLALAGIAEAITGRGDGLISAILFGAGVIMCLVGYME